MSSEFKLKYDQMKANDPVSGDNPSQDGDAKYDRESYARNVCFVLSDKKQQAFNYSYLVSHEYSPDDGTIILHFTAHTVTLTGTNLQGLFDELLQQLPKFIICADERYNHLEENDKPVINKINIVKNGE